jgi:rhodanese-related sulfurtransferase
MKKSIILLTLTLIFVLTSCTASPTASSAPVDVVGTPVSVPGGTYMDISVTDLQNMLGYKDFTLVNVHIPFEGNLPKTDLSIPYDQIAQNLDQLPAKDAKIVLYCRSGRMSTIAAETLVGLGYTNIWQLAGGMVAWEQAGGTIEH